MERGSFIFYMSWLEGIKRLPIKTQKEIKVALLDYCAYGIEPDLNNASAEVYMAFTYAKPQIDANNIRYINGLKGGVQKGTKNNPNGRRGNKPMASLETNLESNLELTENKPNENEYINDIKKESTKVLKKEKRSVFQRPTIEEIRAYILEKGYTYTDADKFFDFYESKNWYVGKNKMKDWKAAVRNWERTDKERAGRKSRTAPVTTQIKEHPLKHETITNKAFGEFRAWQWGNIPRLMNRQPYFDDYITLTQFVALLERFSPEGTDEGNEKAEQKIKDILLMIENRPDTYEQRYASLYATVVTWAAREK